MDWLLGALFVFLVTLGLVVALIASKPAEQKRNHDHCVYCGAELRIAAAPMTPICQECGRQQPWADKDLIGHGRH